MCRYVLTPVAAAVFVAILNVGSADAQASRTWVSGVGDDANPCSRTQPCKTFAGAIAKTLATGTINCLDSGGFGAVTISNPITIDCTGTIAGILAPSGAGVSITATSGTVTLRNLQIDGVGTGSFGIRAGGGANVRIENCTIRGTTGFGIYYSVPSGSVGELYISDTSVTDNGTDYFNGGIGIEGYGTVRAILDRVQAQNNSTGIWVNGYTGSGSFSVTVNDSVSAGNSRSGVTGIVAAGASARVNILVEDSAISNNGTNGILADGANANIFVGGSVVAGNYLGFSTANGGGLFSYNTNMVHQNLSSNGAPLPPGNILPLQ
jgi:Right handed beta helix region